MADRAQAAMSKSTGAPDPLIGRLINDRFKITALIARGGHGQGLPGRAGAARPRLRAQGPEPELRGRARPRVPQALLPRGVASPSKLTHPNTVTIFDYGRTDDDIYYMAMEYLEGHTLHRAIREAGRFPKSARAHIARQICRALREAHSLGVIHRDLKPAQHLPRRARRRDRLREGARLRPREGRLEASPAEELTQAGLFMGSPKYMAPEQIRGDEVDARTDIYSLGIIMYEMLHGEGPVRPPEQREHPHGARERGGPSLARDEPEHQPVARFRGDDHPLHGEGPRRPASARWTRSSRR